MAAAGPSGAAADDGLTAILRAVDSSRACPRPGTARIGAMLMKGLGGLDH